MKIRAIALLPIGLFLSALTACSGGSTHNAYVTATQNGVIALRIENNTGKFTTVLGSPFVGGTSPTSIQVLPNKKMLYTANTSENNISLFKIDDTSGALTEVLPRTSTGISPSSLVLNTAGTLLFAVNQVSSSVSVYSVASTGTLTAVAGSPFSVPSRPFSAVLSPSGSFLYLTNPNLSSIYAYPVSGTGVLGTPTAFPTFSSSVAVAINPAGSLLFAANSSNDTVSVFSVNATSGVLTNAPDSPFIVGTSPVALTTSIDGMYLYVANQGSSNIYAFSVAASGELTQLVGSPYSAGSGTVFVVADPNGKFLYAGSQSTQNITEFSIVPGAGTLGITSNTASTKVSPSSMVVTP